MRFDAFTGGFYSFPSLNAAAQTCMNYYPDLVEGALPKVGAPEGAEKARMVLTPTPGLTLYATAPKSPCRGLWPGQQRLFGVFGDHLYEVTGTNPSLWPDHGAIGNDGNPVQIIPNGNQLFVVSAGNAYWDNGSGVAQVQYSTQLFDLVIDAGTGGLTGDTGGIFDSTDVGCTVQITGGAGFTIHTQTITSVVAGQAFGGASWGTGGSTGGTGIEFLATGGVPNYVAASMGAFLDGTFFAVQPGSKQVQYSALNDASSFDPLNFFSKEAYPDAVAAIVADHEQFYLMGTLESTEVWGDTGGVANGGVNPFQRNPSYFMHYGCGAPFSACRLSTGVAWIGGDVRRGERVAYLAVGFVPQRISTAAIEKEWGTYATVEDAVAYALIMDGQEKWVVSFPTANKTWVYSVTLGEWHQWGWWNGSGWDRHRVAFHACIGIGTVDEVHFGGDWQSGNLYTISAAALTDNGTHIHRRRRAPHLSNENRRRFYSLFELDADTGNSDVDEAPPRVRWLRCGASRDRIYQSDDDGNGNLTLSYSDDRCQSFTTRAAVNVASGPAAIGITAAYMQLTEGTA